uniref:Uncharacterized protein n=1 Tax=Arundo donax TaxID=35708 RepID=A0A0A9HEZ1_ARUDO
MYRCGSHLPVSVRSSDGLASPLAAWPEEPA